MKIHWGKSKVMMVSRNGSDCKGTTNGQDIATVEKIKYGRRKSYVHISKRTSLQNFVQTLGLSCRKSFPAEFVPPGLKLQRSACRIGSALPN